MLNCTTNQRHFMELASQQQAHFCYIQIIIKFLFMQAILQMFQVVKH